ncbi:MAG: phenylacetate-CoA oxygenase/reductase subunit PaaK [Chitinophagaceae bacterium]|nr:phenylacetate-CoA oxygenase/reductase subunit PaaK [Chitinophagaceae bacterium]
MTQFHPLTIKEIRRETPECISILFSIPDDLKEEYKFEPGQNITIKLQLGDEEIRRSYSICSSPHENELRVAVKHLEGGRFSSHANSSLKTGDVVQVLPPTGKFNPKSSAPGAKNYLAFAAGSGITPVISIIKSILQKDSESHFTLVYGNRARGSIIFKEQLEAIKNKNMDRFAMHHILSREQADADVYHGRIDKEKCEILSKYLIDINGMDHFFICGPEEMIFTVRDWLLEKGVAKEKIHFELFTVPGEKSKTTSSKITATSGEKSAITIKVDGKSTSFSHPYEGSSILDGALQHGADLPFACKGGVCATCRAKLISGQVEMDTNYALEEDELAAGFILTCQSHPRSAEVFIDFDVR